MGIHKRTNTVAIISRWPCLSRMLLLLGVAIFLPGCATTMHWDGESDSDHIVGYEISPSGDAITLAGTNYNYILAEPDRWTHLRNLPGKSKISIYRNDFSVDVNDNVMGELEIHCHCDKVNEAGLQWFKSKGFTLENPETDYYSWSETIKGKRVSLEDKPLFNVVYFPSQEFIYLDRPFTHKEFAGKAVTTPLAMIADGVLLSLVAVAIVVQIPVRIVDALID